MRPELGGTVLEVRPGRRLHVATRLAGHDTTIFFVHGAGGNKEQWRFQWRDLSGSPVNLVAWDAVGHGASRQPRDPAAYDGAELVADAAAIVARYRTRRTILVAHSYGARVAIALLLQTAGTADGLVLLGPAPLGGLGPRRLFGGLLGRLPLPLLELARPLLARSFRKRAWHPDADPKLVRAEQRATRRNRLFMMQALMSRAPIVDADRLHALCLPVTVLAGEEDGLVPPRAVAAVAGLLPRATLRILPRCGHQIMLEQPEETNRALRSMIEVVQES